MDHREDIRRPSSIGILSFFQRRRKFNMLVLDESAGGVGCLFTGDQPPRLGPMVCQRDLMSDLLVHVRWIKFIGRQLYKVGIQTPKSATGIGILLAV